MFKHDTAVYIGAGLDFIPVFKFREIRTFIYADCMPKYSANTEFIEELSRPKFPMDLYQTMQRLGFRKAVSDETDLYIYVNPKNGTTIKYYTNLRFPRDSDKGSFLYEVKNASALICCGHGTDRSIINFMRKGPKIFIGDNKTVYKSDSNENNIDLALIENPSLFDVYYKINIPADYKYMDILTVVSSDFLRFQVSKHDTLLDLSKKAY